MDEAVRLSRPGLTVPWGFRLQGGADFNQRLVVQKVTAEGIASRAQIRVGDVLVKIGDVETVTLTHKQACDVIGAAKLQLDLTIVRPQNAHKLRLGSDQTSGLPATSSARPQLPAVETSGQPWLPSSELRRRASSNLTSPLSPRVPRRPPWESAPALPDDLQLDAFPSPPPPLAPTSTSAEPPRAAAAGPALGAQLARLQLKAAARDEGAAVQTQPKVALQSTFTSFTPAYSSAPAGAKRETPTGGSAAAAAAPARAPWDAATSRSRDENGDQLAATSAAAAAAAGATDEIRRRGSAASVTREPTGSVAGKAREGGYATASSTSASTFGTTRRPSSLECREIAGVQEPPLFGGDGPDAALREAAASPAASRDVGPSSPHRNSLQRRDSQSADASGGGGGRAYLVQPNGLVAAVQWNERPPPPDIQNSAVLAALREEQEELKGATARRRSSSTNKHGLSFRVLQLITGTMENDVGDEDGARNDENSAGSPRMAPTSPSLASPTGSVFSTSPKEGPAAGARGHGRTWSTSQDDYSDF